MRLLLRTLVVAFGLSALTRGQLSARELALPLAATPQLGLSYQERPGGYQLRAELHEGSGSAFVLFAEALVAGQAVADTRTFVGWGGLDAAGGGVLEFFVPSTQGLNGRRFAFTAVLTSTWVRGLASAPVGLTLGAACETLDFDHNPDPGFVPLAAGTPVGSQWQNVGVTISADNARGDHPDLVLALDSSNPPASDPDLGTPGLGANNNIPLGTLLIIAENAVDVENDGIIDVPDDEEAGGTIHFDFSERVRVCSVTLVDIDDVGQTRLEFFDQAGSIQMTTFPNGGGNSVQTVFFDVVGVSRVDIILAGSGGVASIGVLGCPARIDFDSMTTGVPLGLEAGEVISDDLIQLGFLVSADNATPTHPDKAILFDTAAPNGQDPDLMTPGAGPGNTLARELVLIVAENDTDGNNDGRVDAPDDEYNGGVISMDFFEDIVFESATVIDIDQGESSFFELFDQAGTSLVVLSLQDLGDNSVQTLVPNLPIAGVRRIELHLSASGAWADLTYCPQILTPQALFP